MCVTANTSASKLFQIETVLLGPNFTMIHVALGTIRHIKTHVFSVLISTYQANHGDHQNIWCSLLQQHWLRFSSAYTTSRTLQVQHRKTLTKQELQLIFSKKKTKETRWSELKSFFFQSHPTVKLTRERNSICKTTTLSTERGSAKCWKYAPQCGMNTLKE